ncbi:MAG: hypothetical protein OYH76_18750 [Defluviicoccus sp.]|nr:hypothetical protein [Defluviicoccus sp.]MDE0277938.1 hypothetical protein [Defluviicoccus sp.]
MRLDAAICAKFAGRHNICEMHASNRMMSVTGEAVGRVPMCGDPSV